MGKYWAWNREINHILENTGELRQQKPEKNCMQRATTAGQHQVKERTGEA